MSRRLWPLIVPVVGWAALVRGEFPASMPDMDNNSEATTSPVKLSFEPQQEPGVYDLPTVNPEAEALNTGGVHLNVEVAYFTDYIYRGVNIPEYIGDVTSEGGSGNANFQFNGRISFDLGKLPHPFIGIFANVLDSDPVNNFEEVRPIFGAEWRIRPLILEAGNNSYIYPDRNKLNTAEVYGKITLDDAAILHRDEPLLSPYIMTAYDYDVYNGWYFEVGVSHKFVIEDTPLSITTVADVAYVMDNGLFAETPDGRDTGFQHWEVGMIAQYNLNTLLNIPQRLGQWNLNGYLFYVDGISKDLRAATTLWGGVGIGLMY